MLTNHDISVFLNHSNRSSCLSGGVGHMRNTNTGQQVFEEPLDSLDVNKIRLEVSTENSSNIIEMHHGYVPTTRYVGRQLNYSIHCEGYEIGFIGVGSSVMAMSGRDKFIGWTKQQRLANITHTGNNWRFTLLKGLPKNTGSKVLSLLTDRARVDWKNRYGDELVFLETMVEAPRTGTVYLASGWVAVGETKGTKYGWRGVNEVKEGEQIVKRGFRIGNKVDENKVKVILGGASKKLIFVKPINRRWKKILCEDPKCEVCVSFSKIRECKGCGNYLTRVQIAHFNDTVDTDCEGEEWIESQ